MLPKLLVITSTYSIKTLINKNDSHDRYIKSEKEKPRGTIGCGFWYIGNSNSENPDNESPNGIKKLNVKTKLIKDFTENKTENFFLAYQYEVQLTPQEKKISIRKGSSGPESYPIAAYRIYFDFYLLDEDGYCLMTIHTDKTKTKKSPSGKFDIMVEKDNKGNGQAIIEDFYVSKDIAERVKKIVYWPIFRSSLLDHPGLPDGWHLDESELPDLP